MGEGLTIVPDIRLDGIMPSMAPTGSHILITGQSLEYVTGLRFEDEFGDVYYFDAISGANSEEFGSASTGGYSYGLSGEVPELRSHIGSQDALKIRGIGDAQVFGTESDRGNDITCCFTVTKPNTNLLSNIDISGSLDIRDVDYDGETTGFLTIAINDDGDTSRVKYRGLNLSGLTGFNPLYVEMIAGSGLVGGGNLSSSRRIDLSPGTGLVVTEDSVNLDTGYLLTTGSAFFNINAAAGLTGDTKVYMGDTLDLGVYVDGETIGFTGGGEDAIGAFKVLGLKHNISGGSGLNDFVFSGDQSVVANVVQGSGIIISGGAVNVDTGILLETGVAHSTFLETGSGYFSVNAGAGLTGDIKVYMGDTLDLGVFVDGETINFTGSGGDEIGAFSVIDGGITEGKVNFFNKIVLTTGNQEISGNKFFHGTGTFQDLHVLGLLTATGDGIWVSDLTVSGIGPMTGIAGVTGKYVRMTGVRWNDTFSTTEIINYENPQSSQGTEITGLSISPMQTGHTLIIDAELNLSAGGNSEAIIALYKDDEATPRRAWSNNVYAREYGQIVRMRHVHIVDSLGEQTWSIRAGRRQSRNASVYLNRTHYMNNPSTILGGKAYSNMTIEEVREELE